MALQIEELNKIFYLKGDLNENADLTPLNKSLNPTIRIDLSGLNIMNSIGIQLLLKAIKHWGDKKFEFLNISTEFANQLDMIEELLEPNGSVFSLQISFSCQECDYDENVEVVATDLKKWNEEESYFKKSCPGCGAETEFEPTFDSEYCFLEKIKD